MVKVEVEIRGKYPECQFVVLFPWGTETCYTNTGLGTLLRFAPSRIAAWQRKRDQAERDFFIPGWDLT